MIRALFFTALAAAAARAQTVSPPQIGFIEDQSQTVRPLYGIAGNFMLGSAASGPVVSFASSGSFQLIKTDSAVIALGRLGQLIASRNAPSGSALFAFAQDGTPGLAYFTAANELFRWSGGRFQAVTFDGSSFAGAEVVSIASPDSIHAELIVQRGDDLWSLRVLLATGAPDSESALNGVNAPALRLPSGDIVYPAVARQGRLLTHPGIVIRRIDGSEIKLAAELPAGFSLQQMGDVWIQLRGDGAQFAIRTTAGKEGVYRVPEGVE